MVIGGLDVLGELEGGVLILALGFLWAVISGPISLVVFPLLWVFFPPSRDPYDMVYSRLSNTDGKTGIDIEREIRADGETLGAALSVYQILETLERQGFVRYEIVERVVRLPDGTDKAFDARLNYRGSKPRPSEKKKAKIPWGSFLPGLRPASI